MVFEFDVQVIRGRDNLFDERSNELESDISCDEERTYPLALRI